MRKLVHAKAAKDAKESKTFDNISLHQFISKTDNEFSSGLISGRMWQGGFMRYFKRTLLSAIVLTFLIALAPSVSDGQRRVVRVRTGTYYPVITRRIYIRDPFWYDRYYSGWGYPFGYDPYFYDPYLRAQRDKYYREKAVRDSRKKLNKNREKYYADGYLTPKEREKLAKNQRSYAKALRKLGEYNGYQARY
jgi:hypothetical protein